MRTLLCVLMILTGCSRTGMVPLAFFSTPSTKPLISIEEIVDQTNAPLLREAAHVIHNEVVSRLTQKDRVSIEGKSPQFSVKMELVKHAPLQSQPSELVMLIHLEILDLREEKPKVILQEVLSSNALIEKNQPIEINWSDAAFRMSPLGLAHRKLSREIASRIEDYVLLAKKGKLS